MALTRAEIAKRYRDRHKGEGAKTLTDDQKVKALQSAARYRQQHPKTEIQRQQACEATRLWHVAHPEKARERRDSPTGRWQFFKSKAKHRGISLDLTFEQWAKVALGARCHYCEEIITSKGGSLDRKNSQRGYAEDNVVPCCLKCNRIRNEDLISYDEMVYIMPLLLAFRRRHEQP